MIAQSICVFGGTFDPIHEGHLRIAEEASKLFALDQVLFVPAANPPHKPLAGLTDYEDRFRMVELACSPYPTFSASRLEEGNNPSYTVDTLRRLRQGIGPQASLFFLIGADAFNELETWKRWQELITIVKFIVVSRPGVQYRIPAGTNLYRLDGLELPVSSSTIRERLATGEATPELPSSIREYIEQHGLYGARKKDSSAQRPRNIDQKLPSEA